MRCCHIVAALLSRRRLVGFNDELSEHTVHVFVCIDLERHHNIISIRWFFIFTHLTSFCQCQENLILLLEPHCVKIIQTVARSTLVQSDKVLPRTREGGYCTM